MTPRCPHRHLLRPWRHGAWLVTLLLPAVALACTSRPQPLSSLTQRLGSLPADSQITQAWSCKDSTGEQLVVASRVATDAHAPGRGPSLLFQKFTHTAHGWKRHWQARDFPSPRAATIGPASTSEVIHLGDYDGDGVADILIAYTLPGQPVPPDEGKLLIFYKDQKYAIRGAIARSPGDFGSRKMSSNFASLPQPIQARALQLWERVSTPR